MKRVVVKIGTNTVMKNNKFNKNFVEDLAKDISSFRRQGNEFIVVTSGAIGMGTEKLQCNNASLPLDMQQACAAVGQSLLMHGYEKAFSKYNQTIAQILLTQDNFVDPEQLSRIERTLHRLLGMNVVPVINENDSVSTNELMLKGGFSDNDGLSSLVAINSKAELLVLVTDVDGVYKADPKKNQGVEIIGEIKDFDQIAAVFGDASFRGLGGFKTKIAAAKNVTQNGIDCVICRGRKGFLKDILEGKKVGTLIHGAGK